MQCQSRMSVNKVFQQKFSRINITFFSDARNATFKCIFSGESYLCFFGQKSNIMFVTYIHIYRKYHISMYFLKKVIFHLPSQVKISCFQEKRNTTFSRYYRKYHIPEGYFWKDHLFKTFRKGKYGFQCSENDATNNLEVTQKIYRLS